MQTEYSKFIKELFVMYGWTCGTLQLLFKKPNLVPCIFIYNCILHIKNNLKIFTPMIIILLNQYETRHGRLLIMPYRRSKLTQKLINHLIIKLFNILSMAFRFLSLKEFKFALKQIPTYYYSNGASLHIPQ